MIEPKPIRFAALMACFCLTGCVATPSAVRTETPVAVSNAGEPVAPAPGPGRADWEQTASPHGLASADEVRRFLSNRTRVSYSPGHGTQVSYAGADGRIFLWYPGNAVVLQGRWRVEDSGPVKVHRDGQPAGSEETRQVAKVCFQYGENTYNPVTRQQGGGWACTFYGMLKAVARESRAGDVFQLARATEVPFSLAKEEATINDLLSRTKRAAR